MPIVVFITTIITKSEKQAVNWLSQPKYGKFSDRQNQLSTVFL